MKAKARQFTPNPAARENIFNALQNIGVNFNDRTPLLAIHDARLIELIERTTTGESANFYERLQESVTILKSSLRHSPPRQPNPTPKHYQEVIPEEMFEAIVNIIDTVSGGTDDYHAWEHLLDTADRKRRQIQTDSDVTSKMTRMVSVDDVATLLYRISDIVFRYVPSKEDRDLLARDIQQLVAGFNTGPIQPALLES